MPDSDSSSAAPADVSFSGSEIGLAGDVRLAFGRINVILGANGAGKTRLLQHIARKREDLFLGAGKLHPVWFQNRNVVYVEGGRTIPLSQLKDGTPPEGDAGRNALFHQRLTAKFSSLAREDDRAMREWEAALVQWAHEEHDGQSSRPRPPRPRSKVAGVLALVRVVFPSIQLDWKADQLTATRTGTQYAGNQLSEGEKQMFGMIVDLGAEPPGTAFLIDEPELHLHPLLAQAFWGDFETQRPDSVFVYATHSIAFAIRRSVDRRFVIGNATPAVRQVETPLDLPSEELRDFLGALPAVLAAESALVVEGENDLSFDAEFYGWLLGDPSVRVVTMRSCTQVRSAATNQGLWQDMAPTVRIAGVVDRDFGARPAPALVVLEYHEAESLLCVPKLLADLAGGIGLEPALEASELEHQIREWCATNVDRVALQRATQRGSMWVGFSIPRDEAVRLTDSDKTKAALLKAAAEQVAAVRRRGEKVVEEYEKERIACQAAVDKNNIPEMLARFEGKQLLRMLAKRLHLKDEIAVLAQVVARLEVDDYPHLVALREQISVVLSSK